MGFGQGRTPFPYKLNTYGGRNESSRFYSRLCAVSAAAFCHPRTFAQNNQMSSVRLTVRTDRLGNKIGDDFTGLSAAILEF